MNDRQRIEWLAPRLAALLGVDHAKAAAASRDSARLGDCFRLALSTAKAPEDALREAIDAAAAMPQDLAVSVRRFR